MNQKQLFGWMIIMLVTVACTADFNTLVIETAPTNTDPIDNSATAINPDDHGVTSPIVKTAVLAPTSTPIEMTVVKTSDAKGVIFPAEMVEEWWWFVMGYREAGENWTPSPSQVMTLEAALIPFLKMANDPWLRPEPPIWERVSDYSRQYIGLIEDGRKIIYGNYFCQSRGTDWQQEIEWVDDGGDCYFQVKYDVEAEAIYELRVNGEA